MSLSPELLHEANHRVSDKHHKPAEVLGDVIQKGEGSM